LYKQPILPKVNYFDDLPGFYQPLFPSRNPRGPSDPLMDQQLREALLREALRLSASEASGVRVTPNAAPLPQERKARWLAHVGCMLCATLLLIVLGRALESWRTSSLHTVASTEANVPAQVETQGWPGVPRAEVSGPVFHDPFADWAPRAVLEKLPAPRAQLVRLPAPRAELVRLPATNN
jgi:hypothetical protein